MKTYDLQTGGQIAVPLLAKVAGFSAEGKCCVILADGSGSAECEILQASERFPLCLAEGDSVLIFLLAGGMGVILGRLGPGVAGKSAGSPEHLLLDATRSLTLQCGEGSITLRGDGKVLIKGANLISKAEKMNRILGASVAVN